MISIPYLRPSLCYTKISAGKEAVVAVSDRCQRAYGFGIIETTNSPFHFLPLMPSSKTEAREDEKVERERKQRNPCNETMKSEGMEEWKYQEWK